MPWEAQAGRAEAARQQRHRRVELRVAQLLILFQFGPRHAALQSKRNRPYENARSSESRRTGLHLVIFNDLVRAASSWSSRCEISDARPDRSILRGRSAWGMSTSATD